MQMPSRPPIRATQPSTAARAAQEIRRLIFDGQIAAGQRVPQDEIAQALGISRIPLREALIALEREGWVTIETHRGAFATALDRDAVADHYALYGITYGFAVDRAMSRSDHGALAVDLDGIRSQAIDASEIGFEPLSIAFHATVVSAARSQRVKVLLRAMPGLVPGNFYAYVPRAIESQRRGFDAIVAAIRAGDVAGARAAYEQNMQEQGDLAMAAFAERGLFDRDGTVRPPRRRQPLTAR